MVRRPLVMGNWKLNGSKAMVKDLIQGLKSELAQVKDCDIAIAPPFLYLSMAEELLVNSNIILGAQNVDIHLDGAFTGDISAEMLSEFNARYIIIGHSERRTYHKETDIFIAQKFAVLKQAGLIPVLCIGETESENEAGLTKQICAQQIDTVLTLLGAQAFENAVIAYEPIWAIGTGKSATPEQAQEVHKFIREHIGKHNLAIAEQLIVLYGGSVNDKNAEQLFAMPDIDGALVGGASLKVDAFTSIVRAAEKTAN